MTNSFKGPVTGRGGLDTRAHAAPGGSSRRPYNVSGGWTEPRHLRGLRPSLPVQCGRAAGV